VRGSQVGASRKMEEPAADAVFHTPSEFMENVSRGENSPDQTVLNTGQETKEAAESDAGKDAATDAAYLQQKAARKAAIELIPQQKLEELGSWLLDFAAEKGILNFGAIAGGNTEEIRSCISLRFSEMQRAEDMCVVLEAQMEGLQTHAEDLLAEKEDDAQQEIEQMRAECRDALAEQEANAEKANAKLTRKLRDSAGEVVELLEIKRQLEAEIDNLKFADCKSETDRVGESTDELKKFRNSLGGVVVDRNKASEMAMAFRLGTNVMSTNKFRDKELTESIRAIQEIAERLNIEKGSGWLASEKLKSADRQMIELDLTQYAEKAGRAKLTKEKAKDWCNVCRVFIEALGQINPVMQRGGLTNMFRSMVDQGGSIEAGLGAYSKLMMAEQDRLSEESYKKVLDGCNDDGAIIQKLIKLFLEPLSTDIRQAYAGEESGVGLPDIGNALMEAWSALVIAKGCLEDPEITDAGESLFKIVNSGEERWKKHFGYLKPILQELEYDFERHVRKFGPINQDTLLRMIFFHIVFTVGKSDFTIKEYLKKLKGEQDGEFSAALQSFNAMAPVAVKFIIGIVENDEKNGREKMKKRAASLVQDTPMRPQIRQDDGGGGRGDGVGGRGGGRGRRKDSDGLDHFSHKRVMFAERPKQAKDAKCDGCGLDAHSGDCVKVANRQRKAEEMAPQVQALLGKLDQATGGEKVRLLSEFGFQQGQLALGRGNGRGGALSGGKGRGRGDAISGAKGAGGIGRGAAFGQRVPTATAPTAAVISGAEKVDKAAGAKKTMADMSTKDKEICEEHNICKWFALFGDCKFGAQCRNKHVSEKERKKKGLSFSARPEEKHTPNESSLVTELLNECCEITDAAPISDDNRGGGETFVSQFGFGFFSLDANTVFTDEHQQIIDQVNQELADESVADMEHDAKDLIMALDYDDMPNGMMDNAEEVEAYNIPVEMTLAMDNDSLPDEDVEEYYDPYYAEQMEDQGSARSKPARTNDHKDMIKRGHKLQQKRRTVCMNQEKQGLTDRVEMRDVYEDPMQPGSLTV